MVRAQCGVVGTVLKIENWSSQVGCSLIMIINVDHDDHKFHDDHDDNPQKRDVVITCSHVATRGEFLGTGQMLMNIVIDTRYPI